MQLPFGFEISTTCQRFRFENAKRVILLRDFDLCFPTTIRKPCSANRSALVFRVRPLHHIAQIFEPIAQAYSMIDVVSRPCTCDVQPREPVCVVQTTINSNALIAAVIATGYVARFHTVSELYAPSENTCALVVPQHLSKSYLSQHGFPGCFLMIVLKTIIKKPCHDGRAQDYVKSSASAPSLISSNASASGAEPPANASPSLNRCTPSSVARMALPLLLSCAHNSICRLP